MNFHSFAIAAATVLAAFTLGCDRATDPPDAATTTTLSPRAAKAAKYHCPMHPTVVSNKPGDCPICSMKLVPIKKDPAATPAKKTMYRSTMNPNEISDKPGNDSMGMAMVPFEIAPDSESALPGLATITIPTVVRERMGLTFGTVTKRTLARDIRTSARIVADETRFYHVTVKVEGWVDHLHAISLGKFIKQGEPLLSIYSPELVSAQQEHLIALRNRDKLRTGADAETVSSAESLLTSSRRRLQLWDITDEQISRLEQTGQVERTVTLYAPATGVVLEKGISAGHRVMPGEPLLTVADLSSVWGDADIYESDLPFITIGTPVTLTLPYWPEKSFTGEVFFVSPTVDPETRTLKARIRIPNPDLLLKPDMYATARLRFELDNRVAVPESAVMQTGEHVYAFRDGGEGRLIPVAIKIGLHSDGYYEVLSGLKDGDRVVTSANFLVDSESAIQAALAATAGK